ncbi:MAG: 30S ribosomal protein S15 [Nitrospirota bacterium]|nr:30S ribosomal protein S15 [Nitrospirota bacterium]
MALAKENKENIIEQYKLHDGDTGSPEVQIALISERLNGLNLHFQTHKKDQHSRRGLLKLVGQRRKLLGYLKTTDRERYEKLIKQLGLRK